MSVSRAEHERIRGYRHEAALYTSASEFLAITTEFILDGLEAGEPTLVVVSLTKIDALRSCLGEAASKVQFADMAAVGANPARIIPAWREFLDRHSDDGRQAVRGIGEPIDRSRTAAELVESQIHEELLNLAFPDNPDFALLCPYDTAGLDDATIAASTAEPSAHSRHHVTQRQQVLRTPSPPARSPLGIASRAGGHGPGGVRRRPGRHPPGRA